ncbi:unnamed protein product [Pleuronectes platessa]|uniref:G-protein coupled receptors family 1 profile domain-containing protein n=1 Tax=Pleuronectes platessa TaxID=8262 RepID=A0A9N7U6F6_PLEPL|nr:unnamed protein product [Pleuronectes platessa]
MPDELSPAHNILVGQFGLESLRWEKVMPDRANQIVSGINPSISRRREQRVLFMVVVMVICYLLCWLPYGIMALMATFGPPGLVTPEASIIPSVLAKTSTVINPVIYVFMNKQLPPSRRHSASHLTSQGHSSPHIMYLITANDQQGPGLDVRNMHSLSRCLDACVLTNVILYHLSVVSVSPSSIFPVLFTEFRQLMGRGESCIRDTERC